MSLPSKTQDVIRVFRTGENTFVKSYVCSGVVKHKIENEGSGIFLQETFWDLTEAQKFCEQLLAHEPSQTFHLVVNDEIIQTVYDEKWQHAASRRSDIKFVIVSSSIIALIASGVSIGVLPFELFWWHLLFIVSSVALYALFLSMFGVGNIESAILIIIILILIGTLALGSQVSPKSCEKNAASFLDSRVGPIVIGHED